MRMCELRWDAVVFCWQLVAVPTSHRLANFERATKAIV